MATLHLVRYSAGEEHLIRLSSSREPERALGEGYRLLGLGMQFAGGIIIFVVGGYLLDRWLGTMPALTIVGTLLGAALSFVNVYLKLQAIGGGDRGKRGKGGGG